MKRTIDLDQIRVVQADNYKGNSQVYLEIMDQRILYSDPARLPALYVRQDEWEQPVVDTDALADLFRSLLGHILAKLLTEEYPGLSDSEELGVWRTDTDRESAYVKPRLTEDPDA